MFVFQFLDKLNIQKDTDSHLDDLRFTERERSLTISREIIYIGT